MARTSILLALCATLWSTFVTSHIVITYPGWRGDNLISNGTADDQSIKPGSLGINWDSSTESYTFPYGMQWQYPCGGMPTTRNRTKWPVNGGAVALQPGWFSGHQYAFFYINLGLGNEPLNMSHNMVPVFQIIGPSNQNYSGAFCLPQVPLPANITVNIGDNATIQVIETAQHGAALYSCVDITFADPKDVETVTRDNCHNTTAAEGQQIGFNLVYSTSQTSGASNVAASLRYAVVPLLSALAFGLWA